MDPETKQAQNPVPPGMVRVRILRPHPKLAAAPGTVTLVSREATQFLLSPPVQKSNQPVTHWESNQIDVFPESPFAELLPDNWIEPAPEIKAVNPEDYHKVVFLKYHSRYAYKPGDIGLVHRDRLQDLLAQGYVRMYVKPGFIDKVKSFIHTR